LRAGTRVEELRKVVTTVFADVVGSMPLGEQLDPEALRRLMVGFFEEAKRIFEAHGGTVAQFSGDAVLGVFGIPVAHEDDAVRGVRSAIALKEALPSLNTEAKNTWDVELSVRIGINTGEVLAGDDVGGLEIVVGDAVNVAARLQQTAPVNEILIGERTQALIAREIATDELPAIAVKGKSEPIRAWRVIGIGPRTTSRSVLPLVGREAELDLLRNAFDRAQSTSLCHLVTVLGHPGIGKTRLVETFLQNHHRSARVARGRCLPYGEGITYWPIVEMIQGAANLSDTETRDSAREKIAAVIGTNDAHAVADVIVQTIGLSRQLSQREQSFWAVRRTVQALAQDNPVIVLFEDLHWGEDTFLDLVEHLVSTLRNDRVIVVCTARDELLSQRPNWGAGKPNSTLLTLAPLEENSARRLLRNVLNEDVEESTQLRLLELAGGNALFLEEMTRALIEDGALKKNGSWTLTPDAALIPPPNIQAALASRLDQLSASERALIGVAAVMGESFPTRALRDLVSEPASVDAGLAALMDRDLVRPEHGNGDSDAYSFRHILIRDAAYEALPKERRAQIHERFADWLLGELAQEQGEYQEIVAYHLEQAHLYGKAIRRSDTALSVRAFTELSTAGQRALDRNDLVAAKSFLNRAVETLPPGNLERAALMPQLGYVLTRLGEHESADEVLTDAIDSAIRQNDRRTLMLARLERERLKIGTDPQGSVHRVRDVAQEAIDYFDAEQDYTGLAIAWHLLGWAAGNEGMLVLAEEALTRAVNYANQCHDHRLETRSRFSLLDVTAFGPRPASELQSVAEDNLAWAEATSDLSLESDSLAKIALARAMKLEHTEASAALDKAELVLLEISHSHTTAMAGFVMALARRYLGDLDQALQVITRTISIFEELDDRFAIATALGIQADLRFRMHDADGAAAIAEKIAQIADEADAMPQIDWRRALAKACVGGAPQKALDLASEAVDLADNSDFALTRADAYCDLAYVLATLGEVERGRAAMAQGIDIHRSKENLASIQETERMLGPLLGLATY